MTMNTGTELGRPIEILLIEDNPGDADIAREGLASSKVKNKLHVVADGEEAMAFLRQTGKYERVPRPDLILLDLNLPRKDGREVLAEVKFDNELRHIPVVVLTSSEKEEDIIKSYQLYANCYITKPLKFTEFVKVVNSIESFWFTIVSFSSGPLR
jgi:two-component system, chemotaxis family, response regulator Rcp1